MVMDARALGGGRWIYQLAFTTRRTPPADVLVKARPKKSGHETLAVSLPPPSGLPWEYSAPPGKAISRRLLGTITGLLSPLTGPLGLPDTNLSFIREK